MACRATKWSLRALSRRLTHLTINIRLTRPSGELPAAQRDVGHSLLFVKLGMRPAFALCCRILNVIRCIYIWKHPLYGSEKPIIQP
jgi:hypothetical protein